LVLEVFKPHVNMSDLEVNHIDGNKLNNHLTNLEWLTGRDNVLHAYNTGLITNIGEGSPNAKLSNADVLEILQRLDTGESQKNMREIKKQFLDDIQDYVERFGRKNIYFYDIEVYPHDSFIVIKDIHKNNVAYFHNSTGFDGLMEYVKEGVLCGYNNGYYDDYV